jgi:hypothetical protein
VLEWRGLVVIGFGDRVHFVSLQTKRAETFPLSSYFGHLHPLDDPAARR